MTDYIQDKVFDEAGNVLVVQSCQRKEVEKQLAKVLEELNSLEGINENNNASLDELLLLAENLCKQLGLDASAISQSDIDIGMSMIDLSQEEKERVEVIQFDIISNIVVDDSTSWKQYLSNIEDFAKNHGMDLSKDPFEKLMTESEQVEIAERIRSDYTMQKSYCDKYDYVIAAFSGVSAGLIDSFFVGMPKASKLGKWTDEKADTFVEKVAQGMWKSDKRATSEGKSKKMPDDLNKCISYLEQRFQVNYDARYAKDLDVTDGVLEGMWSKNHHLKSLSHSPHLIGLLFSILDQFTGEASFVDNGKLIRVVPKEKKNAFELKGNTFAAKLFCGFCNWIGHILSDLVGSSSTRNVLTGKTGRGSGLPIPFFELLQFCNFGSLNVDGEKLSFAELSISVFEHGYDLRLGATMAIPVFMNEIMIRILWSVKHRYYHNSSWKDSFPFGNNPELRRMLLVGHGSLCLLDGVDSGIRPGGSLLNFALRLNFIAWMRFALSGLVELRAMYKSDTLDIEAMDKDLGNEWTRLLSSQ